MEASEVLKKIESALSSGTELIVSAKDVKSLEEVERNKVGRKSELNEILRSLKDIPAESRGEVGKEANIVRSKLTKLIEEKREELADGSVEMSLDVTAPGNKQALGHLHLTTQTIREITKIFERIGFYRVRYPTVEWDWYAFSALNFPEDHPARDDWETFFIDKENIDKKLGRRLLTPHTSSGQVREMETGRMPIRMINISKCPRRQLDVSHTLIHHQFEGLVIDKHITIAHLKGVLDYYVKEFFGPTRKVRIRPYDFKFTEPSFEVDISCGNCGGEGCRLCKEGWLEIGGAGMVHPNVLKSGGIDPDEYLGLAFGWGVERNMIMRSGINIADLRMIYQNDIRFLKQF